MATVNAFGDAQKAALLTAIAQQGSAGADAYKAQMTAAQQAATQAASDAQQRSALIGAPPELTAELAASGQGVANTYGQDARAAEGAQGDYLSALRSGNNQYMSQLGNAQDLAALITGAYQKQSEDERAFKTDQARRDFITHEQDRQAELEDRNQARDWAREQHQWDVENHQYELDKRNSASKDPFSGSLDNNDKALLLAYARQYATTAHPGAYGKPAKPGKGISIFGHEVAHNPFGTPATKGRKKVTITDALDQMNADLGKPKGWVQAVLGKDSPDFKAKTSKVDVQKLRQTKTYKANATDLANHYKTMITSKKNGGQGLTVAAARADLANQIRNDPNYVDHPNVYEQLIRDVLHA